MARLQWTDETKALVAACLTDEDLRNRFPGVKLLNLKNRRSLYRNELGLSQLKPGKPEVDPIEAEVKRVRDREMVRELTALTRQAAKKKEFVATIKDGLAEFEPSPLIPAPVTKGGLSEHSWMILMSDWHVGQYTPIETTGGIYEQTVEVTRWQIETLLNAIRSIHAVRSRGELIKKLLLVFAGDLVEGDQMRWSQARKIEKPVTVQCMLVYDLAAYLIRQLLLLAGIENIEVHMVGGNHDRTSQRPGDAGLGELDYVDTYAWLVGAMLERGFEGEPRVKVVNWDTFFGYTEFCNRRIVFEHGATFKIGAGSYGGVPWYGVSNAARKHIEMMGGADIVALGHLHQPAVLPLGQSTWGVINGALPATTSWVQSSFKSVREPVQWMIDLHKDRGVTGFEPLYAIPEQLLRPGEVWERIKKKTR